ncbi:flavoprotein [Nocardiopsis sp. NPDC049922]|uniref:flavoprotein n=1 Tax=Nocardiopsis sp. NPDC049922 TaxID=3155157 RepID=UPI00340C5842
MRGEAASRPAGGPTDEAKGAAHRSADGALPPIGFSRLLLVGSGSMHAAYLPGELTWLRTAFPDLAVQVVLTRSAHRFVTPTALGMITGRDVIPDTWPDEPVSEAVHVRLTEWADAAVVFPASLNFLARLALGLADSPALLALQCTRAPIVVAPSVPSGGWNTPVSERHTDALARRGNVAVVPPVPVRSWTTGRDDGHGAAPLAAVVGTLELLRRRTTSADPDPEPHDERSR